VRVRSGLAFLVALTLVSSTGSAGTPTPSPPEASEPVRAELLSPRPDRKLASLGAVGGLYLGLSTWAYFAWYYNVPNLQAFKVGGDGWFGQKTYAGGADKLGHLWANLALARGTTELLRWGGWRPLPASIIGSSLSWSFFLFVEIKDGYYYQLSPGDMAGNTAGALLSAAMTNWPALDRAIDFRVQYFPSEEYLDALREDGDIDVAEDYSGQTYLLAFHLSAIPDLRNYGAWNHLSRYLDVAVGYQTRRYRPVPEDRDAAVRKQSMFVGLSLNLQGVIDDALEGRTGRGPRLTRQISHGVFEMMNLPYTTLPVVGGTRSPDD
jgi:hypothetical protein